MVYHYKKEHRKHAPENYQVGCLERVGKIRKCIGRDDRMLIIPFLDSKLLKAYQYLTHSKNKISKNKKEILKLKTS
jgi:hypothetical protein